ncbi:MAG: hypothetical protein MZW92_33035 [Comamonadaceae bacterium]|nr:hypothetical protein [Comamonadaceae bacterium]
MTERACRERRGRRPRAPTQQVPDRSRAGTAATCRVSARHRADRVDAGERLADDAAGERRGRRVRLARAARVTVGRRTAAAVDEALARVVVRPAARRSAFCAP